MMKSAMQRLPHIFTVKNSLSIQSTHGQAIPEPGNGAQAPLDAFARYLAKKVDAPYRANPTHMLLRGIWPTVISIASTAVPAAPRSAGGTPASSSECVREDTIHVGRCDAASLVADA